VHPKTVSRALKRGGPPTRGRRRRGSALDPYKPRIDDLFDEGVWNAQVILREIQVLGYTGGITVLKNYIHPKRVMRSSRATVRFETPPGRQLQSDWGEIVRPIVVGRLQERGTAIERSSTALIACEPGLARSAGGELRQNPGSRQAKGAVRAAPNRITA